ncbi:hypothetical protein ALC56_10476 [Trachymyrmex septentrionalis]|uniref:ShKT domain-containing protein n=1 Tax=Trachymyrmex septentrionalis TaxID=34720 RepID=A0A195F4J0_9HYME|nr:hypothetical protein ALC56_10476 [Trachymyrmex septentrionalis]
MEVTHLLAAYLLVVVGLTTLLAHAERNAEAGRATEAPIIGTEDQQQKVYDECRNPDYKKYVKCLMRPKRHGQHTNHGDGPETDSAHCLETCLKKCEHHLDLDCEKKCGYCTKRTRHRHQIITEYETECESGNCGPSGAGLRTTNITTNIGINNVINPFGGGGGNATEFGIFGTRNGTGWGFPPAGCCPPGGPCRPGSPPCYPGSVPSLPIVPQISLVPQITYGVGFGAAGGCAYNQWLCIQQTGAQFPSVQPDCSGCGNPVLRYKCDVNCYAIHNTATKPPCKSPECIGGKKQGRIKRVGKVKGLYPRAGSATGNRCSCDTGSFERVLPVNVRTGRANGASSLSSAGGRYRCIVPPVACELPLKRSV